MYRLKLLGLLFRRFFAFSMAGMDGQTQMRLNELKRGDPRRRPTPNHSILHLVVASISMFTCRLNPIALLVIVLLVSGCAAQPSNTTITTCV